MIKDDSDNNDQFIIGAIYEYEHVPPTLPGEPRQRLAPHYIVAFCGTMIPHPKVIMDLYLDLKVMVNTLPESKLSHLENKEVRNLIATTDKGTGGYGGHGDGGSCIVWLMGHSLGTSLALDMGQAMMAE